MSLLQQSFINQRREVACQVGFYDLLDPSLLCILKDNIRERRDRCETRNLRV